MAYGEPPPGTAIAAGGKLVRALDDVPCAIALFSVQGRIEFGNRLWTDLVRDTGGAPDDAIGLFEGADLAAELAGVLTDDTPRSFSAVQGKLATRDAARWWDLDLVPQRDGPATATHGVLVTARDVTSRILARREAEDTREVLGDTASRLRLAQHAASVGTWEWDILAGRVWWSPEQFRLHGMDPVRDTPPSYENWLAMVHPEDRATLHDAARAAFRDNAGHYQVEFRLHRDGNGADRWLLALGHVVAAAADGTPRRMLGVSLDVTERRRAEEHRRAAAAALARSEARFRGIFDSTFQFIGLLAPDGTVLEANRAALDFGGLQLEDVVDRPFWQARWWAAAPDPETPERLRAALANAAAGHFVRYEVEVRGLGDGTAIIDFSLRPVCDASGQVVYVVAEGRDITARRAEQEARLRAEQRLGQARGVAELAIWEYELATGAFWIRDGDDAGNATALASGATAGTGADLGLEAWLAIIHPEDRDRMRQAMLAAPHTLRIDEEFRIKRDETGEVRWIHSRAVLHHRSAGPVLVGINQDVTERLTALNVLRGAEQSFPALADALPAFVFVTDAEGRNTFSNAFFQNFVGRTAEALLGDGWISAVHPQDISRVVSRWRQAVATGLPYTLEYRFRRNDGAWRAFFVRGVPDRDAAGRILRWIGTAIDLHDLRCAETARSEAEERLRLAIGAAELGAWNWNLETGALDVSPRCLALYGLPEDTAPDWDSLAHAVLPDDRERRSAAVIQALRTQSDYEEEYRVALPDGSIAWRRNVGRVEVRPDGGVQALRGVVFDIDQHKRAEASLRDDRDRLEERVAERTRALSSAAAELASEMRRRDDMQTSLLQSQKLEALGHLTGGVAHDFNNILAAIQGGYHLLNRQVRDNPKACELVRQGMEASTRGARLIAKLMAFARKEELRPRRVEIDALLRDAEELICQTAGARVRCAFAIEEGLWPVIIDPIRLETALMNLAANARDAMPNGGALTISARRAPEGELPAGLRQQRGYIRIAIADTGTVMDPETLRHAAEPFFTTKPHGKGTGLGLASAHGFAEQSGGTLRLLSTPGEGTTVELFVPRADIVHAALPEAFFTMPDVEALDRSRHGAATILLADDDDGVRPVTADLLRELGYRVLEASSAEAAETLALAEGNIDMLVTDVVMAGAAGTVLAARLRRETPGLPVIYITGFGRGAALEDTPVLLKPFSEVALARAVLHGLGRLGPAPTETAADAFTTGGDRVTSRIRSLVLRDLHRRWLARRAASEMPAAGTFSADDFPGEIQDNALLLDVLGEGRFRYAAVGRALAERLGHRLVGEILGAGQEGPVAEVFGDRVTAAYQRCVEGRGVHYDYARYTKDGGHPVLFERLLLPLSAVGHDAVAQVFGVALFTDFPARSTAGGS